MENKTSEELKALREEIQRELGYVFQYDTAEFSFDEDITVIQVRSSMAGHGSSALPSYIKQSQRQEERLRLMKDEWDRALHRLKQHKLKKKRDAELAMEQAMEDEKQKQKMSKRKRKKGNKSKRGKKGGRGSSSSNSDDDDSDCDWNLLVTLQGQKVTQQEPLDTSVPVDNVNDKQDKVDLIGTGKSNEEENNQEEKSVEEKNTSQISEGNNNGGINDINKRRAEFQLDQCEEEEQECIF